MAGRAVGEPARAQVEDSEEHRGEVPEIEPLTTARLTICMTSSGLPTSRANARVTSRISAAVMAASMPCPDTSPITIQTREVILGEEIVEIAPDMRAIGRGPVGMPEPDARKLARKHQHLPLQGLGDFLLPAIEVRVEDGHSHPVGQKLEKAHIGPG